MASPSKKELDPEKKREIALYLMANPPQTEEDLVKRLAHGMQFKAVMESYNFDFYNDESKGAKDSVIYGYCSQNGLRQFLTDQLALTGKRVTSGLAAAGFVDYIGRSCAMISRVRSYMSGYNRARRAIKAGLSRESYLAGSSGSLGAAAKVFSFATSTIGDDKLFRATVLLNKEGNMFPTWIASIAEAMTNCVVYNVREILWPENGNFSFSNSQDHNVKSSIGKWSKFVEKHPELSKFPPTYVASCYGLAIYMELIEKFLLLDCDIIPI